MAVNLSPYGGVGAQFLDNAGNVLTGGRIETYAAGTTTPQATYTSSAGFTFHSNPIILDASGRVPSGGEIWLTDGLAYKFVLKDSNNVLIATYDNVTGINSNFVNFVNEQEIQTATAGQTVFTLTTTNYQPGTNSLSVFVDGVNQYGPGAQYAYLETNSTTVTFVNGLHVGALVKFTTSQLNSSGATAAAQVSFTGFKGQAGTVQDLADDDGSDWIGFEQTGTGAVAVSAQDKMREWFSVKDFGAVGDGVTDDTAAIQLAFDAANGTKSVMFPDGSYKVTSSVDCKVSSFFGQTSHQSVILCQLANARAFTNTGRNISNLTFDGTGFATADAFEIQGYLYYINNCRFLYLRDAICPTSIIVTTTINQCLFLGCFSAINDKLTDGSSAHTTLWFTSNSVQYGTNAFVIKTEAAGMYYSGNVFEQLNYVYFGFGQQTFNDCWIKNWFEQIFTNVTIFHNTFAGGTQVSIMNDLRPGAFAITDGIKLSAGQYTLAGQAQGNGGGSSLTNTGLRICNFNGAGYIINSTKLAPASASANFAAAQDFIIETQNANVNATSRGGDLVVNTGAGSNSGRKGALRPQTDDTTQLGDASFRWSVVYSATPAINTSDANEKEQVVDLSESEKAVALTIKSQIKRFKFKDAVAKKGDNARYHFGAIAQEVGQVFKDNGLNPDEYGVFCRDVWYTEIDNETGEETYAYPNANGEYPANATRHERLGLRYDELFAFIIFAL